MIFKHLWLDRNGSGRATLAVACAALFPLGALAPANAPAAERPDIVVLLTDDQGQLDSTPYGAQSLRTPNLQRLADAGLTFDAAYVASPSCAPSRAALLTGLMPARNGAEANHSKPEPKIKKWPAYFQEHGYEVVSFGKVAHYGHTADYGFDHFAHDTFFDAKAIPAAVEYLLRRKGSGTAKPLCLMVGSNWPHVPWPEKDLGYDGNQLPLPAGSIDTPATREWRARYAAAVTRADDDLGKVMDAVQEALPKETLVLMSSDHGAQWPFGKWNCYEAGVRVPLIVSWPGVIKPGSRSAAMVSWVDILPTLLEVAGGSAPSGIDGRSFLGVLRDPKQSHRDAIFTTHSGDGAWNIYPIRSLRAGHWKYIRNLHPEFAFTTHIDLPGNLGQRAYFVTWEEAAKTDGGAAAILRRYHARPGEELFDLSTDPHEQRNLASESGMAERLKQMRAQTDEWMKQQDDVGTVFAKPRLLSDPGSFGPTAPSGAPAAKGGAKKGKAARQ